MIKTALIGIGGMGGMHYNAHINNPECKLIAVADVRTDMAREKVEDKSINIYHDLDELLKNEKPDVVDICTPSYLHAELSIKALEGGCNVLCEKPMSINSDDCKRVMKAAEKSGKFFMTAHVVRFMKPYIYLKNVIKSAELGKLIRLDMKRLSSIPLWSWENWMRDITKSGGVTIDLSVHDIDFMQSVLGTPETADCVYYKMHENNDFVLSTFTYGDAIVTTEGAWYNCDYPFSAGFNAVFENGYIKLDDNGLCKNGKIIEIESSCEEEDTGINIKSDDALANEIAYFIDCVKSGKKPEIVTPESSTASIELVEKLLKNAKVIG